MIQKLKQKLAYNKFFNYLVSNKLDIYVSASVEGLSYYYPDSYKLAKMQSYICDEISKIYPNIELIDVNFSEEGISVKADMPLFGGFVESIIENRLHDELGDMIINAYCKDT